MLFISIIFIFYFLPLTLIFHYVIPERFMWARNGVLLIALAKKTVKDRCLSCGAPLTGVVDENSKCSYCGNLIMGVLEKR